MTIYCVISVVLVIQTYGDQIKTIRRQTVIVEETNCLMIHCSIDIQLFNNPQPCDTTIDNTT